MAEIGAKTSPVGASEQKFSYGSFFLWRFYSLTGVVSLFLFLLLQTASASLLLFASKETTHAFLAFQSSTLVFCLEILFITLPVLFHVIYNLKSLSQTRFNLFDYAYQGNVRYIFQRVSSVVVLVFVLFHVTQLVWVVRSGAEGFQYVRDILFLHRSTGGMIVYWTALMFAWFYQCQALWNFLIDWGITVGQRSQRVSLIARMGVFGIMAVYCICVMVYQVFVGV